MPEDLEPVKTDVVMYGFAAKIYNENDSKVLKTWKEGEKIWIAWTQRYRVGYIWKGHRHRRRLSKGCFQLSRFS